MPIVVLQVTDSATRLDRFIASRCSDLSRSTVQHLIRDGRVLVNGSTQKASYHPAPGDTIRVEIPPAHDPAPPLLARNGPLHVLYEDDHVLAVAKPSGLVMHPAPGHAADTLVNRLLAHRPDLPWSELDSQRPGIVHRLDRDTSGVVVVATSKEALTSLQAQFKRREVKKRYLALGYGSLEPEAAAIEAPIGRDPRDRKKMAVVTQGGRYARTEYQVLEYLAGCTLLEAMPLTGRTHQVRVHFASIQHPIVGDKQYGPRRPSVAAPRQMLHAHSLEVTHPVTGERLAFSIEPPADFQNVVARLRGMPPNPQASGTRVTLGCDHSE